ncbi:proteasome subunit beta type-2 [Phlebotomus argentipes]|uniref:proteasome subunit beta type-2 n=1 Tax=Phlebotomus argentipes TaxID=94469 RepID=UPI0028933F6A|nr:proteasome subunit beta type-2 [Phlebotomus argentipes]
METIIGLKGKDFVMIAADCTHAHSIIMLKEDERKISQISDNLLIATTGESGDTVQFTEYISKNIALYKMRNGYELGPKAAAHFTRKNLADCLRSRSPYFVNLLVAGYDEKEGAELHFIDYLANAKSVNYAGHGYGGMFCASIFDRYYNAGVSQDDAYEILKKCVAEIQKRLIINLSTFNVAVVDKKGTRFLHDITSKSEAA